MLAGVRGTFAETWSWESAALYTRGESSDIIRNGTRESVLLKAVADGKISVIRNRPKVGSFSVST